MKGKIILLTVIFLCSIREGVSQSKIKINSNKEKYQNEKVGNTFENKYQSVQLPICEILDTSKNIVIRAGAIHASSIRMLKKGILPLGGDLGRIINIKVSNCFLFFSLPIYDENETLAGRLFDNRLILLRKKYYLKNGSNYLQIFNEKSIPIFTVKLEKESNSLIINGLFFFKSYWVIMEDEHFDSLFYKKPISKLSKKDSSKIINECYAKAKKILQPL